MEFWKTIREDPLIAWFVFFALLLTVVPAVSVLWRKMSGRNRPDAAEQPVRTTKPTRFAFGSRTDLVILLLGLLWLLAAIGWIRSIFFA